PPQAAIIPVDTGNARAPVRLTCHVWGFYPRDVTVIWLRNDDILGPGDHPVIEATSNGDWTYQTRVTLTVAPKAGDVFTCSVQHVSLEEPLLVDWRPGLSLAEALQVTLLSLVTTTLQAAPEGLRDRPIRVPHGPPSPAVAPGTAAATNQAIKTRRVLQSVVALRGGEWDTGDIPEGRTRVPKRCPSPPNGASRTGISA
ncbi:PREDICTED: HLA class II histocompatibility antigen, DM beta chain-like, partial [Tinamus guttatus]|uniref:HLA class II histocompatibility antigen, DM beta chain-like n=1 Tax=Tinamus guttatus TaxID=94827 RepID=UPI00052E7BF1